MASLGLLLVFYYSSLSNYKDNSIRNIFGGMKCLVFFYLAGQCSTLFSRIIIRPTIYWLGRWVNHWDHMSSFPLSSYLLERTHNWLMGKDKAWKNSANCWDKIIPGNEICLPKTLTEVNAIYKNTYMLPNVLRITLLWYLFLVYLRCIS